MWFLNSAAILCRFASLRWLFFYVLRFKVLCPLMMSLFREEMFVLNDHDNVLFYSSRTGDKGSKRLATANRSSPNCCVRSYLIYAWAWNVPVVLLFEQNSYLYFYHRAKQTLGLKLSRGCGDNWFRSWISISIVRCGIFVKRAPTYPAQRNFIDWIQTRIWKFSRGGGAKLKCGEHYASLSNQCHAWYNSRAPKWRFPQHTDQELRNFWAGRHAVSKHLS